MALLIDEALIDDLASDLGFLSSSVQQKSKFERHLKNGAFYLTSIIGEIDVDDTDARSYVINYARYDFYGVINEFFINYRESLRHLQVKYALE